MVCHSHTFRLDHCSLPDEGLLWSTLQWCCSGASRAWNKQLGIHCRRTAERSKGGSIKLKIGTGSKCKMLPFELKVWGQAREYGSCGLVLVAYLPAILANQHLLTLPRDPYRSMGVHFTITSDADKRPAAPTGDATLSTRDQRSPGPSLEPVSARSDLLRASVIAYKRSRFQPMGQTALTLPDRPPGWTDGLKTPHVVVAVSSPQTLATITKRIKLDMDRWKDGGVEKRLARHGKLVRAVTAKEGSEKADALPERCRASRK